MDHSLDPHQLAALMSVTMPYDRNAPLPRTDIHEQNVMNRIIHDPYADYPIVPELDALAGISISKPDLHQAVALAVQLCPREKEIRLTVAWSGEIDDKIPEYLSSVWAKLAMISQICATQRAPKTVHPAQGTLPISSETDSTITEYGCRVAMFREVYRFGLAKHISSMKKYSTGLGSFVQHLRKRRGWRVELQGLENKIHNCYAATLGAIIWFETCAHSQIPIMDHEWDYAYSVMNLLIENCLPVLADDVTCENLVRELQGMLHSLSGNVSLWERE
ncbi:hypothetical protein HOY82DRAFT_640979 [Tuber indicum]|nr:hypothetical protein HOY82DRAFT_640979 [Tuber indicum]